MIESRLPSVLFEISTSGNVNLIASWSRDNMLLCIKGTPNAYHTESHYQERMSHTIQKF